jgi:hypothetical protein
LAIADCRLQIYGLAIVDWRLAIVDWKLVIVDWRLVIAGLMIQSPIVNKSPINNSNRQSPIANNQSAICSLQSEILVGLD